MSVDGAVDEIRPASASAAFAALGLAEARSSRSAALSAFGALLLRDLTVLRKELHMFLTRTVMQPFLLVFVFAYVFPKIGQGIGGQGQGEAVFSTLLVGGVVGMSMTFQGIQSVALPLVQDFGFTREIEDRVLAPLPVWAVALGKVLAGAMQATLVAVVVFPLALWIPATPVHLEVQPLHLVLLIPLGSVMGAALGLTLGTRIEPRQVTLMFSMIVMPMTFLGAVYYPWQSLEAVPWLQWLVTINPLLYLSEGLRLALAGQVPHMAPLTIYLAMLGYTSVLLWAGLTGFRRRVVG